MTKTFTRFLSSLSDEELEAFTRERSVVQPPYWKLMQVALRIEFDRRRIGLGDGAPVHAASGEPEQPARSATA